MALARRVLAVITAALLAVDASIHLRDADRRLVSRPAAGERDALRR
jgi:hypothetical protein